MLVVASIGLVANLAVILLLRGVSHSNLNVKAAFWHIIGDTISSVGVIVAAVIIAVTGWGVVDPIIAVFIGCIILWGAVRLVRESVDILMESVRKHIQYVQVIEILKVGAGVEEVHVIHVWTGLSGSHLRRWQLFHLGRCFSGSAEIVDKVNRDLSQQFNITHTTLQLECERCESCPSGTVCNITRAEEPARRVEQI